MVDVPISLPPGVVQTSSKARNSVNYFETNFVRWDNGRLEPVGGWAKLGYATVPSTAIRAMHQWRDNSGHIWRAFLSEDDVYVEYDGDLYSINPTAPLTAWSGDFSAGGYGDGPYGDDTYGTPRAVKADRKQYGPCFTLNNWGENLLIMSSADGRLLEWVPPLSGAPSEAAVVSGAPTANYSFVVTPERHVILFQQGGNFNQYAWCNKEDNTNWDFADVASEAGYLPVEPSAPLVAPLQLGSLGTLFWTTQQVYLISYVGVPDIYGHSEKGEGTLPISSASVVRAGEGAFWPAENGWWGFNGVSIAPIECPIWDWVSTQWDLVRARQTAFSVHILSKAEIWFFFPTVGSTTNNRVAIYNYRDQWWSQGKLSRSAGMAMDSIDSPYLANAGYVYRHEYGDVYADASDGAYAETFTINIAQGANYGLLRKIIPELKGDISSLSFRTITSNQRAPQEDTLGTARKVIQGQVEFMEAARDFRLRISSDGLSALDWTMGSVILDIGPKGKKK